MVLDVSDVLNTVMQFLKWNRNIHWQWVISCGYRTSPTKLLMAEMTDILSLNNGVAISGCLQCATSAIFEMFRGIKISLCPTSQGRMPAYTNRTLQDGLEIYGFSHFWVQPLATFSSGV